MKLSKLFHRGMTRWSWVCGRYVWRIVGKKHGPFVLTCNKHVIGRITDLENHSPFSLHGWVTFRLDAIVGLPPFEPMTSGVVEFVHSSDGTGKLSLAIPGPVRVGDPE